jgi:hypothetical protein
MRACLPNVWRSIVTAVFEGNAMVYHCDSRDSAKAFVSITYASDVYLQKHSAVPTAHCKHALSVEDKHSKVTQLTLFTPQMDAAHT